MTFSEQRRELIVHRSTPGGEGAIAVFELYGSGAAEALRTLLGGADLPQAGRLRLAELLDAAGDVVDEAIVGYVPATQAWCRMDGWRVSVHGGLWIQRRLEDVFAGLGGRSIDRRELLRRSVASGCLDAVEAAAYELLVAASTGRAAAFFLRQYRGELSRELRSCADLLTGPLDPARSQAVSSRLDALCSRSAAAVRLSQPLRVLISGRPNAGKSTLFNRLVGEERAAVSPDVGTTRDLNHATIAIDDFLVEIVDSAGVHSAPADPVEARAMERVATAHADVVLYLLAPPWLLTAAEVVALESLPDGERLVVANFADCRAEHRLPAAGASDASAELCVSARTGEGVDALQREIARRWLLPGGHGPEAGPAPFTPRQISLVRRAAASFRVWQGAGGSLDGVRDALIECLASSWS